MRKTLLLSSLLLLLTACPTPGDDDDGPPDDDVIENPFTDYTLDPYVFAAEVDLDATLPLRLGEVVPDQVIVVLEPDAELQPVLDALGATRVGQIPDLRAYQLRLPTDTLPELEAARDAADGMAGVEGAALNFIQDWHAAPGYCLLEDDNSLNVAGPNRCGFSDIGYYQAARILQKLAEHHTLSPVKVAVVDSGLQLDFGAFDDVYVLNLENPAAEPTDNHGHGTRVSGVIAADDGDGSTNGIASIVLGRRLGLEVGGFSPDSFKSLTAVWRAVADGHADVVNMSYGARYDVADRPTQVTVMGLYRTIAAAFPNTVFVTSAGNHNEEVTEFGHAPPGLDAPNFLTVGGTPHCEPTQRWIHSDPTYGSSWGPRLDVSAPAQSVPLLPYDPRNAVYDPGGAPIYGSGTSYSSPMVAATAALMKSFDPGLTGAQVKDYLTEYTYMTDESLNWRRHVMMLPIEQMLIDRGASADLLDLIDADDPLGEWDVPSHVLNRICDGADLSVSGAGAWTFFPAADESAGFVNDMGFGLVLSMDDGDVMFTLSQQGGSFELDRDYSIPTEMEGVFSVISRELFTGAAGGTVRFTDCAVTDRNPLDETPMVVQVAGAATDGWVEGYEGSAIFVGEFDARWNVPLVIYPGSAVVPVLEQVCEGGLL